jgi:Domain of unknown function (DUF6854)
MPIVVVTQLKGKGDHAPFAREAAALLKKHGALSVRVGRCIVGGYAGDVVAATAFADWAAYGRAMQALSTDPAWQKYLSEVSKAFDVQARSIIAGEDF